MGNLKQCDCWMGINSIQAPDGRTYCEKCFGFVLKFTKEGRREYFIHGLEERRVPKALKEIVLEAYDKAELEKLKLERVKKYLKKLPYTSKVKHIREIEKILEAEK